MGQLKFLEFFAGAGLARLGLGEGWSCLFANDWDSKKASCYKLNWPDANFILEDISCLELSHINHEAHLAWASFPCQDLSLAGAGAGLKGKRSGTFWPFWDHMQKLKSLDKAPSIIVLENVCGMITSNGGSDLDVICNALAESDYRVGAIVIDASLFLPHSRPRLFIIGISSGYQIPKGITSATPNLFHTDALRRFVADRLTINPVDWIWWNPGLPTSSPSALDSIVGISEEGGEWDPHEKTCDLLKMMSPTTHKKVSHIRRSKRLVVGTVYKRMRNNKQGKKVQRAEARFDGLAGCLRAPTGGSSRQQVIMIEGNKIRSRLLTAREALELMGVPEHFIAPENYNETYRIAGEGVAVPVVRHLAEKIIEPLIYANEFNAEQ